MCVCVFAEMSWPPQFPATGADPNITAMLQQLQQGLQASQMQGPAQMTSPGFANPAQQAPSIPTASAQAGMDPVQLQMMLARVISMPLASMLFQSMMGSGSQPAPQQSMFQSPPVNLMNAPQPPRQSPSPLLHLIQQAFQAGAAASSVAAAQAQPTPASSPSTSAVPQIDPSMMMQPAYQTRTPSSSLSGVAPGTTSPHGSTSPAVQLPPMDPSVAKEVIVQLAQQLQQSGHLPNSDIQRLLQPQSDDSNGVDVSRVKKDPDAKASPICVIASTESRGENSAARPEVYMDVAADERSASTASTQDDSLRQDSDSDNDGGYAATAKKSPRVARHTSARRGDATPRKSSSAADRISAARKADPKLRKICLVKLDKVDDRKKTEPAGIAEPLSRIARLKNVKNLYSVDVLHCSSKPVPSAAAGSARQLAAATISQGRRQLAAATNSQGPGQLAAATNSQDPSTSLQPSTSSNRFGSKNIFSIFAQHASGRGHQQQQQEEPTAEVRPSDPLPASLGMMLQRSVSSVENKNLSLRSMYLGYVSHNMEWLSLVSCTFAATGDRTYCQCTFCPSVGEMPANVAMHINADHQDLMFALNRLRPVVGPLLYIKCSHCNYVTVESTLAWIHFDTHHGISDILDCSSRTADVDMSGPDTPAHFIDIDETMGPTTAYVCFDCSAVNVDTDTRASAMLMARHVTRQHPDSLNTNGNFVKLMMLTRSDNDPEAIKGKPTYRQAVCNPEHARGRREVYICMFCRYMID